MLLLSWRGIELHGIALLQRCVAVQLEEPYHWCGLMQVQRAPSLRYRIEPRRAGAESGWWPVHLRQIISTVAMREN